MLGKVHVPLAVPRSLGVVCVRYACGCESDVPVNNWELHYRGGGDL